MKKYFLIFCLLIANLTSFSQPFLNGKRFDLKGIKLGIKNNISYISNTTVGGYSGTISIRKNSKSEISGIIFRTNKSYSLLDLNILINRFCNFYKIRNLQTYLRETYLDDKYPPTKYNCFQYYIEDKIKIEIYFDNRTRQIIISAEDLTPSELFKELRKAFIESPNNDF